MPELPEVETVVEGLRRAGVEGRRIVSLETFWARSVLPHTPNELRKRLVGRRIDDLQRRAKYICLRLDTGPWLLVHLRMTGRLLVDGDRSSHDHHDRVVLGLDDGRRIRLHDTRKFARIRLVNGPTEPPLCDLGPEPLEADFTWRRLAEILQRRRAIKPLLLDQHCIAGLGNIYVDESLWEARIHPCRHADSLTEGDAQRLHRAIRRVLKRGIHAGGTSLGRAHTNFLGVAQQWGANADNLRVFRRQGQACPRCKETLKRLVVAQRATHICPVCQIMAIRSESVNENGGRLNSSNS